MNLVIIGGVAGGATAAAKARRESEQANITMFEKGKYVSFANCGLPFYIGGEIKERNSLLLQSPESFAKRYRIKAEILHEVMSINRKDKSIRVLDLQKNETKDFPYDKLILSTGATAIVPPFPGVHSSNIFQVKTVPDADKIRDFVATTKPKNAVVIGGGFIGLETAEALLHQGLKVTVVELMSQIMPPFDPDMARIMQHHIENEGISVITSDGVKSFLTEDSIAKQVELNSGKKLDCDLVILSIGVRPEIKLAKEAGLTLGVTGGIQVNQFQQTSDDDIYAVGDSIDTTNLVTGKPARFALAGPANKQGRIAAFNAIRGNQLQYPGSIGTSIVQCLGASAGMTGLTEKACKVENIPYVVSIVHPLDHAGYYPGAHQLHIKMVSSKETGRILGVQIVGETGVDKRVDVLATAITGRLTVYDFEHLDLAYAPQFGSAQDAIVQAAFSATDALRGEVNPVTYEEYLKLKEANKDIQLVDVRNPSEFEGGHLEDAVLIPLDEMRERCHELKNDKETIVYCKVGMRGYLAARILVQSGFTNVKHLIGGYLSATL